MTRESNSGKICENDYSKPHSERSPIDPTTCCLKRECDVGNGRKRRFSQVARRFSRYLYATQKKTAAYSCRNGVFASLKRDTDSRSWVQFRSNTKLLSLATTANPVPQEIHNNSWSFLHLKNLLKETACGM